MALGHELPFIVLTFMIRSHRTCYLPKKQMWKFRKFVAKCVCIRCLWHSPDGSLEEDKNGGILFRSIHFFFLFFLKTIVIGRFMCFSFMIFFFQSQFEHDILVIHFQSILKKYFFYKCSLIIFSLLKISIDYYISRILWVFLASFSMRFS